MDQFNRANTARLEKILQQREKNVQKNIEKGREFKKSTEPPLLSETTNINELSPQARQEILSRQIRKGTTELQEPKLLGEEGVASVKGAGSAAAMAALGYLANKYPDLNPLHMHDAGEESDVIPEEDQLDSRFKKMKQLMEK